ncbi:flagellar assembly protein A [Paenibacillus tarimensis]|uniref:flagellar assembly protein A n=1 Tax=Paenibacillus tarimensis TaxID=416012 RepID=UPI001F47EC23|nr:flagellar assembly protein A [Paenibacillus tarimensis]MCF2942754.1 FapA family protein [Paenibacillus tarimensis]
MERSVVSKGKTVLEAVDLGLVLLGISKESANIEIIESESKALFGLKSKPAVVRITVLHPVKTEQAAVLQPALSINDYIEHLAETDLSVQEQSRIKPENISGNTEHEGKAWVKDGQIFAKTSPNNYPLISPVGFARLKKNGIPIEKTVILTEQDKIEVSLEEDIKEPDWRIDLIDADMKAVLEVKPGSRLERRLKDSIPSTHLLLEVEECVEVLQINEEEIHNKLADMGVTCGIIPEAIQEACKAKEPGSYVVAKGVEPVKGENGRFEMSFDTMARTVQPKKREDGTIDYREIKEFPAVEEGQILGFIIPRVPGQAGSNVKGEPVEPLPVHDIVWIEGYGTTWTDSGSQVVATRAGMPQFHQQGLRVRVSIIPKLLHRGDVTLESGNLHFLGDIEVTGSVQDSMKVESSGSVTIRGNVNMANVVASQSLIVKANIISSKITVGKGNLLYAEMEPLLKEITAKIAILSAAIEQIGQAAAFKMNDFKTSGLRPLLNVLLRGKFKTLADALEQLTTKIEANRSYLDEEWHLYGKEIYSGFLNQIKSHFRTPEDLRLFMTKTEYFYSLVEPPLQNHVFTKFDYAHNSQIYSGGDISIGKGCYNSMIFCQGTLEVYGFVKGGVYFAQKGIIIREAGAAGHATTKLHVPEQASIRIDKVLEGTVVQLGKRTHKFIEDSSRVHVRLNSDGEIIIR